MSNLAHPRWTESPVFAVKHWRNKSQETETALEDFLYWLEYDRENEQEDDVPESDIAKIKVLIDQFLGRDPKKIEKGEKELLKSWIKACK